MYLTIDTKKAAELIHSHFGIKGSVSTLPGELELNFKVDSDKGRTYVLKISPATRDLDYLQFQQQILQQLNLLSAPKIINDLEGDTICIYQDKNDNIWYLRVLSWIEGRIWSSVNPNSSSLRYSLGLFSGKLSLALMNFDHKHAHRNFEWDLAQSLWVESHLDLFNVEEQALLKKPIQSFKRFQEHYKNLRKSVVHNDVNDNNIIVSDNNLKPEVLSIIDFGDAIYTQLINDLAICCAYAIMDFPDPLEAALPIVKGYHTSIPLVDEEVKYLYTLIGMRLVVSVTKSALNKVENPKNEYLWISEKPARELLKKWMSLSEDFVHYRFREACGFEPHPNKKLFNDWIKQQSFSTTTLFPELKKRNLHHLDLSVFSSWVGREHEFNDLDHFQFKINQLQKEVPDKIIAGGYLEPRPLYTSNAYSKIGNEGRERRCLHLGVDFWVPANTPVHSLLKGTVVISVKDNGIKAYGGLIVLKHQVKNFSFYTLYGHLSHQSIEKLSPGVVINENEIIGKIGTEEENGNWAPHLHFQVILSLMNYDNDFPGVTYTKQINTWNSICPDPNLFFKDTALNSITKEDTSQIRNDRKTNLGRGMSLQYQNPLHVVRGEGVYLVDGDGRPYLDMVNNVAHVGHEHLRVVKAGQLQMGQLNTNSRYLHQNITRLAKNLLATFPPKLSVVHFVNSGSEANELAIRMMKTVSGSDQILASQIGYHGNTNSCIDVSSYKFDGEGGSGKPSNTHLFPIPDSFRGKYRGENTTAAYLEEVKRQIKNFQKDKKPIGGIIIEPIISCGGQIELPQGFLKAAFKEVRAAGGLCIIDEVQTGCGRVGSHFWGFQLHGVIPDIVTIGKPLGNGHPVAAVVCTSEVAERFDNGMEFFNTFGGNPVSCAIANEVLNVVKDEKLQANALVVGNYIKKELKRLAIRFPIIGDVRGQGLFLGLEFVNEEKLPLADHADYIINRMKNFGILLSTDGPDHNVIKIKPPLVFSLENAKEFLHYFAKILNEDFMKN